MCPFTYPRTFRLLYEGLRVVPVFFESGTYRGDLSIEECQGIQGVLTLQRDDLDVLQEVLVVLEEVSFTEMFLGNWEGVSGGFKVNKGSIGSCRPW